jgi:hypothetical protein
MRFIIAKCSRLEFPNDNENCRAFCYWQEGENEIEKSFTDDDLAVEIAHLKLLGQPTKLYEDALKRLRSTFS